MAAAAAAAVAAFTLCCWYRRAMDLALNLPKPCDLGTYSVGGSLGAPNGTCRPCPPGYSTQTDQSVGDWECNGEMALV
jgi:hypothetical protein